MAEDARKESFVKVIIRGQEFLFTENRIDRSTVPEDIFLYEVRYSDDSDMEPAEISEGIMVNFYGTLLSKSPITKWDDERGARHYMYLKFSNIPAFYETDEGICDKNSKDAWPHFAPLQNEWNEKYDSDITLEEYIAEKNS